MFNYKFLFSICFFYLCLSCKKDITIRFKDNHFSSENNIVTVNIPLAEKSNHLANSINTTINNHVIDILQVNSSNSLKANTIKQSIETFNLTYKDFLNDFPKSSQPWEAQIDGEVLFKNEDLISISLTSYINTGGAHGILNISFLNFDTSNGKQIKNENLFSDIETFKSIAKTYFDSSVKDKDLFLNKNKNFRLPHQIGFSDDGVILLYNTYEIAPYSTGVIEFTVPLKEARPYLVFSTFKSAKTYP